jgi:hypothetical protein
MLVFPRSFLYKYRAFQVIPHLQSFDLSLSLARMDLGSRISRSFDNSEDSSSSAGSTAPLSGPADSEASGEVTSPSPQDIWAELSGLKLVLASHKHTLMERSNRLSRLMGELDSKDHQLALANRQIQLRDRRIAELETKLADVYKGWAHEAYGEHARVCLLVDTKRECQQLHKRCRFWRSQALAKTPMSSDAPHDKRSG